MPLGQLVAALDRAGREIPPPRMVARKSVLARTARTASLGLEAILDGLFSSTGADEDASEMQEQATRLWGEIQAPEGQATHYTDCFNAIHIALDEGTQQGHQDMSRRSSASQNAPGAKPIDEWQDRPWQNLFSPNGRPSRGRASDFGRMRNMP